MALWVDRSFTRPGTSGTAYAAGDLIANSATAGSVVPMVVSRPYAASQLMLRRIVIVKSNTSLTNASFRVRLFTEAPVLSNGDNGVLTGNLSASHYATYSTIMDIAYADGAVGVATADSAFPSTLDETLWAVLEARAGYAENASEVFRLRFELAEF